MVPIDPITREVIQNRLITIVREMSLTLQRAAYSPIIAEVKDYSSVLLRPNGDLVAEHTKQNLCNAATRIGWQAPDDRAAVEIAFLTVLTRRPSPEVAAHFEARLGGVDRIGPGLGGDREAVATQRLGQALQQRRPGVAIAMLVAGGDQDQDVGHRDTHVLRRAPQLRCRDGRDKARVALRAHFL